MSRPHVSSQSSARDDEARAFLERAGQGVTLAWDPILKDAPCFDRFEEDSVYQAAFGTTTGSVKCCASACRPRWPSSAWNCDQSPPK